MSLLLRSTLRLRTAPIAHRASWTAVRTLTFLPTYVAEATVAGARGGHLTTKRGSLDLKLSVPKELGAQGGPGTNPEELLGGGYAACFGGALGAAARNLKMKIGDPTVTSVVSLGPKTPKGFQLAVELQVAGTNVEDDAEFDKLIKEAHAICPFSHALRSLEIVTRRVFFYLLLPCEDPNIRHTLVLSHPCPSWVVWLQHLLSVSDHHHRHPSWRREQSSCSRRLRKEESVFDQQ